MKETVTVHTVRIEFENVAAEEARALREHFSQQAVHERLGGHPDLIGQVGKLYVELRTAVRDCPEGMLRGEIALALLKVSHPQPVA